MSNGSVLLIDASRLFREGLRRILSSSSLAAVHEACSVQDALPSIESLQPALVIVNFPDAGESQREAIGQIRAAAPRTRIVVLTETIRVNRLSEALSAGADGYLLKNISADALHQSLQLVLLGEKVFPTDLANLLTNDRINAGNGTAQGRHANGLSDREMQILGCLLNGAQNKQIARDLRGHSQGPPQGRSEKDRGAEPDPGGTLGNIAGREARRPASPRTSKSPARTITARRRPNSGAGTVSGGVTWRDGMVCPYRTDRRIASRARDGFDEAIRSIARGAI
jgi:two-component system nitrate/nitrite response regulator NarL